MTAADSAASPAAAPTAPAPALPRFAVKPYQPDGGFEFPGLLMLLTALIIAGGVLGYAAHWVSQYFYLILLFPAGIGFALGVVGTRMIRQGRVRNPWIGGLAGFLGGVLAMTMMHYFDYEQVRKALDQLPEEVRQLAQMSPQEQERQIREDLDPADRAELDTVLRLVQVHSFLDYMNFEAEQGVEISKAGRGDRGLNLGYTGSWIYWALEILVVAGITFAMVRRSAAEPYCAACGKWKTPQVLSESCTQPAIAAAQAGDLAALGSARATDGPIRVTLACCDECVGKGAVDLKLEAVTIDSKGNKQTKAVAHVTYPPESLPHLQAAFTAPAPAAAPAASAGA